MMLSGEGDMDRKEKAPLCGGRKEDRLTKLLPRSIQSFNEDLKKLRMEMGYPEEYGSRARSIFSHGKCEHAATHHDAQCSLMPRSIMRWMEGGRMLERKTLSDLLQEYESQTERFRDHNTFQEFCKIQVERSKQ